MPETKRRVNSTIPIKWGWGSNNTGENLFETLMLLMFWKCFWANFWRRLKIYKIFVPIKSGLYWKEFSFLLDNNWHGSQTVNMKLSIFAVCHSHKLWLFFTWLLVKVGTQSMRLILKLYCKIAETIQIHEWLSITLFEILTRFNTLSFGYLMAIKIRKMKNDKQFL